MKLNVEYFPENKSKLVGYMEHLDAYLESMSIGKSPFLIFLGDENLWTRLQLLSRLDRISMLVVSGPNPPSYGWHDKLISYVTNWFEEGRNDEGIGAGETKFFTNIPDLFQYLGNNTQPPQDDLAGIQYLHPNIFFNALEQVQEKSGGAYKLRDGEKMIWDESGAGVFIVTLNMMGQYEDIEADQEKINYLEETFNLVRSELEKDFYFCYLSE